MVDFGADNPRNPRKHRRLDDDPPDGSGGPTSDTDRPAMSVLHQTPSYKESLMKDSMNGDQADMDFYDDEDIDIQDGDVTRSLIDGLISIEFSDRVQSLAEKSLDQTLVVKLLGDPPDPKQQLGIGTRDSQHAPHVPGMADNSLIDFAVIAADNSLLPGGSQECPDASDIADKPLWRMATSHSFSICSAYESLVHYVWSDKSSCWKCIWAQPMPQRLRFFLWLSFKERLMTNVERCRRSIGQSQICPCCQTYAETTAHVLRDCQLASAV
ncbi:hypothetical protein V6N11_077915 [Hibiscus sabdariffa]|uniref:Reverse transcriptase zinc-binding domain-containing protein n=1 Tax=Hibiscus sabdariffa TaxID=183260 RepID=A0ABR2TEG1_9ROSI